MSIADGLNPNGDQLNPYKLHYTSKNGSRNANNTTKGRRGLPRRRWSSTMHVLNVGREEPPKHHKHAGNNVEEERAEEEQAQEEDSQSRKEEEEAGCTNVF